MRKYIAGVVLTALTIVMSLATGMMFLQIQRTDAAISDVASIKAGQAILSQKLDFNSEKLDTLALKTDKMQASVDGIALQIKRSQTDPFAVLTALGVAIPDQYSAGFYEGEFVVFPRTPGALQRLKAQGVGVWTAKQVTPVLQGYIRVGTEK